MKYSLLLVADLMNAVPSIQENMELSGDGYQADVIGESTPDVLVSEFVSVSSFNLRHLVACLLISRYADINTSVFISHYGC